MSEVGPQRDASVKNLGWQVTLAGLGINLALGILYTWSVVSKAITKEWQWTETQSAWPYSIACLTFSFLMVPAGRLQDRMGPRLAASIGGLLVGAGMILASLTGTYWGYILGFGVLAGAGIGFGYAAATPPAVKWFPAAKTGMIAGIVVSGFGLASVYAAPLANWLLAVVGIGNTMLILGIAFLIVVVGLAQLLVPPPKGYVPAGTSAGKAAASPPKRDYAPSEMCRTAQFYLLWFMYACGAGAGLMIISKLAKIGEQQAGITLGFVLVAALAVGNGAGRIAAGSLSDVLGRQTTMLICFLSQAVLMIVLSQAQKGTALATVPALAIVSALIGANYGANLALFPSITKDYYGLKNFGVNYGLVFTAWGVGGFLFALLQGYLYDAYKTFAYSCYAAAGFLVLAAVMTFTVKPPRAVHEPAAEEALPELSKA
jgi:OFA family oxalate/formate antiporter-like MFS transporter